MCTPPLWPKRTVSTNRPRHLPSDVIEGLSQHPKRLSPKYFYDAAGSELFEQITVLPEYYPTRTELGILRERAGEIGAIIPEGAALVEFGAGATTKVRLLLEQCAFGAYVPGRYIRRFPQGPGRRTASGLSAISTSIRLPRTSPRRSRCPTRSGRCRRSDFSRDRRSAISSRTRPAPSCAAPAKFSGPARRW